MRNMPMVMTTFPPYHYSRTPGVTDSVGIVTLAAVGTCMALFFWTLVYAYIYNRVYCVDSALAYAVEYVLVHVTRTP